MLEQERQSKETVETFKTRLPAGAEYKGAMIHEFSLRKLTRGFRSTFQNMKLAQRNAPRWYAECLCHLIEKIGEYPVYAEWKASGEKTIPEVLKAMVEPDMLFVMVSAHCQNFSPIQNVKRDTSFLPQGCMNPENCQCQTSTKLNLWELPVDFEDEFGDPFEKIRLAELEDGIFIPPENKEAPKPYEGKKFNRVGLRRQTLGDLLRNAGKSDENSQMDMLRDCIVSIEEVDGEGNVLNAMSQSDWDFYEYTFLDRFCSPQDIAILKGAMGELPGMRVGITDNCRECKAEFGVPFGPDQLFPKSVKSKKKRR